MADEINEPQDLPEEVVEEEIEEPAPEPTDDVEALKSRLQKLEEKAIAQRERTKILRQELAKQRKPAPAAPADKPTGELTETQLDYLDLKGITNDDDIAVIQKVMARTGQTVRQALADDYVKDRLAKAQAARDVQGAIPSGTKRSGSAPTSDISYLLAQYERTGELPQDFTLRAKVIEAKANREGDATPPWRR